MARNSVSSNVNTLKSHKTVSQAGYCQEYSQGTEHFYRHRDCDSFTSMHISPDPLPTPDPGQLLCSPLPVIVLPQKCCM